MGREWWDEVAGGKGRKWDQDNIETDGGGVCTGGRGDGGNEGGGGLEDGALGVRQRLDTRNQQRGTAANDEQ